MTKGICRLRNTKQDTPVRQQEGGGETFMTRIHNVLHYLRATVPAPPGMYKKTLVNNGINGSTTNPVPGEFIEFFPSTLSLKH